MKFNTAVLSEVSYQLLFGNPHWGMLLANEYLTPLSPIRRALTNKFKERISYDKGGTEIPLNDEIISGKKLAQITSSDKIAIGPRVVRTRREPHSVQNRSLQNRHVARLAVRSRRNDTPRFTDSKVIANAHPLQPRVALATSRNAPLAQ
jgi:hypothetical protein